MDGKPEFITDIEDFDFKPRLIDREIQRKQIVLESTTLWRDCEDSTITVPTGFISDLASIPWFVGFILAKLGKHQRAAVLHDWLYRNRIKLKGYCDKQFNDAMKFDGVVKWRRLAIIGGLKIGGRISWHKDSIVEIVDD